MPITLLKNLLKNERGIDNRENSVKIIECV